MKVTKCSFRLIFEEDENGRMTANTILSIVSFHVLKSVGEGLGFLSFSISDTTLNYMEVMGGFIYTHFSIHIVTLKTI